MEAVFHKMTKHTLQDSTGAKVRHTFIFEERGEGGRRVRALRES